MGTPETMLVAKGEQASDGPATALEVFLVDDEAPVRRLVGDALRAAGHRVTVAADGAEAMTQLSRRVYDVVITDVRLPKVDGFTILRRLRHIAPATDVLLITAYGTISDAVTAIKEEAFDYLTKPFDTEVLVRAVARIGERRRLKSELVRARAQLAEMGAGETLIGRSPAMARLRTQVNAVADTDASVLLSGESGTGKGLVARLLHERSNRRDRPFVALNCAAFPPTLLEAELFGYERGAFTGAARRRDGRFKAADGGTLFLDEIGELPPESQAKLLRVLEEGAFEPLGTNQTIRADVRVLSATNRDLKALIAEGRFREDLFFRVRVIEIAIPPLRDRQGDLPLLVEHFLRELAPPGRPPPRLSASAWAALGRHPFPGNVRELAHAIKHATVLSQGREIGVDHLPPDIAGPVREDGGGGPPDGQAVRPLAVEMAEHERAVLLRALAAAGGEKGKAADLLGISRKSLWEKLRRHALGSGRGEGGA